MSPCHLKSQKSLCVTSSWFLDISAKSSQCHVKCRFMFDYKLIKHSSVKMSFCLWSSPHHADQSGHEIALSRCSSMNEKVKLVACITCGLLWNDYFEWFQRKTVFFTRLSEWLSWNIYMYWQVSNRMWSSVGWFGCPSDLHRSVISAFVPWHLCLSSGGLLIQSSKP